MTCSPNRTLQSPMLPLLLTSLLAMLAAPRLDAIEVTTTVDENGGNASECALREAVRSINTQSSFGGCTFTPGDATIELSAATYELSLDVGVSDRVELKKPATIRGVGPHQTIIERVGVFDDDMLFLNVNDPGTIVLEGFTLQGSEGRFNSAIDFLAETGLELVIRDVIFRDNVNEIGAAFRIQGDGDSPIFLERVIFEDNVSFGTFNFGGGLDCSADESSFVPSLHLVDVLFRNNSVESSGSAVGGALNSEGCDLVLENVTFDGNTATSTGSTSFGGAVAIFAGDNANTATLTNVTFFGNSADVGGAYAQGDFTPGSLDVTLSQVTFAENAAAVDADHLYQDSGDTSLRNVLFGPSVGDDCGGNPDRVITSLGGNMDSDGSCAVERTEVDPGLANGLGPRGGFTPVLSLVEGAAAIDAGTNTGCAPTDQRGVTRPEDGDGDGVATCDIGAFEASDIDIFADGFESGDTGSWSQTVD